MRYCQPGHPRKGSPEEPDQRVVPLGFGWAYGEIEADYSRLFFRLRRKRKRVTRFATLIGGLRSCPRVGGNWLLA